MKLKKKIKNYLLNNNINSLQQLTDHIEVLKASEDLSIDDRNILFNLVYCVCNKKDSLLSFFGENKISKDVFIDLDNLIKSSNKESIKEGFWNMDMTNTDVVFGKDTCITNFFTDWNYQENLSKEMTEALNNTVNRVGNDTPQYRCNSPKTNLSDKNFGKKENLVDKLNKDLENMPKLSEEVLDRLKAPKLNLDVSIGKKENNNKISYSEIDFDIIDLMAQRFNSNKHKYPQGNMLKPIDKKELLFAAYRHLRKMIQPIDGDDESFEIHLASVMCNMQMVYQQVKLEEKKKLIEGACKK